VAIEAVAVSPLFLSCKLKMSDMLVVWNCKACSSSSSSLRVVAAIMMTQGEKREGEE